MPEFCWVTQLQLAQSTNQKTLTVKIYPDTAKVDGANLAFIAKPEGADQKMVFYARLKDKGQQHLFMNEVKPIVVEAAGKVSDFLPATNLNQFDARKYYHHQKICHAFWWKIFILKGHHPSSRLLIEFTLFDQFLIITAVDFPKRWESTRPV